MGPIVAVTVRAVSDTDHDRIVELSLEAWVPVFSAFEEILGPRLFERVHPDWRTAQAAAVRASLAHHPTWVAVDGGLVVGFVNVVFDDPGRSGEIYMIAVDPAFQRRGVASVLTELALTEMRRRGITLAVVATGGDPGHAPARATYERAGFTGCPQVWYARRLD